MPRLWNYDWITAFAVFTQTQIQMPMHNASRTGVKRNEYVNLEAI